jgi:FkbM family methyltransferase
VSSPPPLVAEVIARAMRTLQAYVPGEEPARPTLGPDPHSARRRLLRTAHRGRDLLERGAGRAGFVHPHADPEHVAVQILRLVELGDGLQATASELGDEASRRALTDVLVHRIAGPYHAPLQITPDRFRALQAHIDRTYLVKSATLEVADPYFSPISLYRVPAPAPAGAVEPSTITLHAHSVDIASVYELHQYAYRGTDPPVAAQPGEIALDIGGCWGDTALYLASLVGPSGRVLTFEFDPANLAVMRTNLALNPELAERIEIIEAALWDQSGADLPFASGGRMTIVGTDAGTSERVRTLTLDDALRQAGVDRVDFVKMDVEGAEPRVLAGASTVLGRDRPRLAIAAYHRDDDLVVLPAAIREAAAEYRFYLQSSSPLEDETVLFACVGG